LAAFIGFSATGCCRKILAIPDPLPCQGWGRGFESPRPLQSNQWLSRLGREIPSCSSAEFPRNLFGRRSPLQLAVGELDAREGLAILGVPDKSAACLLSSSIRNSLPQSITLPSSH